MVFYNEKFYHRSTAHIVSKETALALYEAGYPQPDGMNRIIQQNEGDAYTVIVPGIWIYRPSATEIVEQMKNVSIMLTERCWVCFHGQNANFKCESINPAEAAALMWLKLQPKSKQKPIKNS